MSLLGWLFGRRRKAPKDNTPQIVELGERKPIHSFETTLSGIDLENPDGSMRQDIIARTTVGTETILVAQMGALKLAAVFVAETGEQLGYLPREVSTKIIREAKGHDYGTRVAAIGEPDPETGVRDVTLAIDVFEKG
ncbi:MAG: hypothetical protein KDC18_00040 [Alphaproteobacteria bacterium]|nr:hypothetical protein [Alphaproteobacteria bacterium]MCB9928105.1 hypothetical protein [Alphaproteobacteria bacterium]